MVIEQSLLLIGLLCALCVATAGLFWLLAVDRRRREKIRQLEKNLETLKQTVGALCSSAVGVDRRVNRVERHGRDLEERQENIESQKNSDPPYADAIRLVKEGADAAHLVEELGLNRGAADLIIMMHGLKSEDEVQG
ncbi:MAG: DUF2802 domain-containing protein [Pseudomonadota bacterium]